MPNDLTTDFITYIRTLKAAAVTAQDVTTLIKKDEPTVRTAAAATDLDDYNTMYKLHLD